jgi:thiosulfate reductase cytochrome b subunit
MSCYSACCRGSEQTVADARASAVVSHRNSAAATLCLGDRASDFQPLKMMTIPSQTAPWTPDAAMVVDAPAVDPAPAHPRFVRITHWLTTIATIALVISGVELIISHPRFYWGEVGNVNTTPLFSIPIPSSRTTVPTGYSYTLPDQNGWSRSLHFQSAWLVLFAGIAYLAAGARSRHVGRRLVPEPHDRTWRALRDSIVDHLQRKSDAQHSPGVYNALQRTAYLCVLFVLFPLVIWTGLAMSPGFTAVVPWSVTSLGGHQSARTLHFVVMIALVLFTVVHVVMIARAGFGRLMRAMILGSVEDAS